jgi:hypothetical protein
MPWISDRRKEPVVSKSQDWVRHGARFKGRAHPTPARQFRRHPVLQLRTPFRLGVRAAFTTTCDALVGTGCRHTANAQQRHNHGAPRRP